MNRWEAFSAEVPGKWVLAGEHAVLRGATAIALPHPEFRLKLRFTPGAGPGFSVQPSDAETVVREVVVGATRGELPSGLLEIESSIPLGAGLGSSAAFCVALTRWMSGPLGIEPSRQFEYARNLEHRFHGKSSGMDVAATSSGEPIEFTMAEGPRPLGIKLLPKFTFHDTGLRAKTSDCVAQVEALRSRDPLRSAEIDQAMWNAAQGCGEGLARYDRGEEKAGLETLAQAMKQAQDCYLAWGLMPAAVLRLRESLLGHGALATKLTGAGGGGFLVALWPPS